MFLSFLIEHRATAVLAALCILFSGCLDVTADSPPTPMVDASVQPPPTPTASLTLEAPDRLALGLSESAAFTFRYENAGGEPVAGVEVTFAMVGSAHDSTLEELEGITDGLGKARGILMTGTMPATFRIRASAPDARSAYLDVAVSDGGFGSIRVTPVYSGERRPTSFSFSLYNQSCDEVLPGTSEPLREIQVSPDEPAEFLDLPASASFTVVGQAIAEDGHFLAVGCTDELVIEQDTTLEPALVLEDLPLDLEGRYDVELVLETSGSAAAAAASLQNATDLLDSSYGSPSGLLLSSLLEYHSIESIPMTSLQVLVDTGEADRELGSLLSASSRGYDEALEAEAGQVSESLNSLSIQGTLVIAGSAESPETWMTRGLSVTHDAGGSFTDLDISEWIMDRTGAARLLTPSDESTLDLRELSFSLPLGSLANHVFLRGADITDTSSTTVSEFRAAIGCTELAMWVTSRPEVETTCDSTCTQSACNRALAITAHKVTVATAELNARHDQVGLSGAMVASDDDADRYPESIEGSALEGSWATSASPYGHDISGTLRALRSSSF